MPDDPIFEGPPRAGVWRLGLRDWAALDTVRGHRLPFALWTVGEQPLLHHWLDAAVDQGYEGVELYVADRPAEVRRAMESAELWPLSWTVHPIASEGDFASPDAWVDRLPWMNPVPAPEAGWDLLEHWFSLEQAWLGRFEEETEGTGLNLAVGRSCEIHPSARLNPPFWIGDAVMIGPGSTIGPGAVIGDGAIVVGDSIVERAHLAAHTLLGPGTDLSDALLDGRCLLNFRHRAKVGQLDSFIGGSLQSTGSRESGHSPSWRERWWALCLWWRWRKRLAGAPPLLGFEVIEGLDGRRYRRSFGPLWHARFALLGEVIAGRRRLLGIAPRTEEEVAPFPPEWREMLRAAPVGVLSYADLMESPIPGEIEEAVHALYQIYGAPERCDLLLRRAVYALIAGRSPLESLMVLPPEKETEDY